MTDALHDFVDGRHRVRIADSIFVQISVVNSGTYATVTFGHAHDRTGHQTVRWADEPHLEQLGDLTVGFRLELVWHAVRSHLPRDEIRRRLDSVDRRVAQTRLVTESVGELIE